MHIYSGTMSATQRHLWLLVGLCLTQCTADLSFIFGDTSLFNVNFKTPAWLGRQIPLGSNIRIETDVDPNIQEDSHLNTVSEHTVQATFVHGSGRLIGFNCSFKWSEFFI